MVVRMVPDGPRSSWARISTRHALAHIGNLDHCTSGNEFQPAGQMVVVGLLSRVFSRSVLGVFLLHYTGTLAVRANGSGRQWQEN